MTEADIASYAELLRKDYDLDSRLLRRLIRIEVGRTKDPRLYDLDFDVQLVEAMKILDQGNFKSLVKSTKTLKELQEEAEAKENDDEKNAGKDKDASGK